MATSPAVQFMPAPADVTSKGHRPSRQSTRGNKSARMEITVQTLFGVACNDEGLTAKLSFSGSLPDMQVGSSIFDPVNGLLSLESEPLLPGAKSITWPRCTKEQPPHLTVNLEERKALDARTPLQKANRDSIMVSREAVEESYRFSRLNSTRSGTCTVFWSDTSVPDIVELAIRFGDFKGMAYLVFFGHKDDLGTCIMDLPVRRAAGCTSMNLSDNARIRVKVNVAIPDDHKLPPVAACSTSSSEDTAGQSINYTRTYLEEQIAPLMAVIRNNEVNAAKERYFEKHNVGVKVPRSFGSGGAGGRASPSPLQSFCSLGIWEQLRQTLAACSGTNVRGDCHYHQKFGSSYDDSSTLGSSTIATRESWDL